MLFSSPVFVCVFLPVVFLLYCVIPSLKLKNALLIAASLIFYAYGEPIYVFLMLFCSLANYIFALCIDRTRSEKFRKLFLVLGVLSDLGVLGYYKYAGFFTSSVNRLTGASFTVPQIALPVGISFFTFQALSYVVDVYRKTTPAEKNFANILLYISFFPQLIAGPIVKFHDINEALSNRSQNAETVARGLRRFIVGLSKKVLIANVMGQAADMVFAFEASRIDIVTAWLGAVSYMLQIYYDFSGYSDMAIGLGHMFGFDFKENFIYPYSAVSIKDFWRRWHISMSTWFKEYLYIPLGGNRKGKLRTSINKLIVFFCTGFWHGAGWTFILWGLFHGFFLFLEEYIPKLGKLPKALAHIYTLLVVMIGFVLFRADTVTQALTITSKLFVGFSFDDDIFLTAVRSFSPWFIVILIAAVLGAGFMSGISKKLKDRLNAPADKADRILEKCSYAVSFVLLAWCLIRLSGTTYNPFIYFRF